MTIFLKNRIYQEKPIHILDADSGDSLCGWVGVDKVDDYYDKSEIQPDGDMCKLCDKAKPIPTKYEPRKSWAELNPEIPREERDVIPADIEKKLATMNDAELLELFGSEFSVRMFRRGNRIYHDQAAKLASTPTPG